MTNSPFKTITYYILYTVFTPIFLSLIVPEMLKSFNIWQTFGIACIIATGIYHIVYYVIKPLVEIIHKKNKT